MEIVIHPDARQSGQAAALAGAALLRAAIEKQGHASIIVATGASQFDMLAALVAATDIDWPKVTGFHLDEYLGLSDSHPASFCKYLRERFVENVPLADFHYVNGQADGQTECERLAKVISSHAIDVAFVGIGENGHLAFNDPPADFDIAEPYITVELDEACRKQQHGEGWFATLDDVPTRAISMSVKHIMKSAAIVCTVPDERKAAAVAAAVDGPVTNYLPASSLQTHDNVTLFLDSSAASQLKR